MRNGIIVCIVVAITIAVMNADPIAWPSAGRETVSTDVTVPAVPKSQTAAAPQLPKPKLSSRGIRRMVRSEIVSGLRQRQGSLTACGNGTGAVLSLRLEIDTNSARIIDVAVIDAGDASETTLECVAQKLTEAPVAMSTTIAKPIHTSMSFQL